MTENYTPETYKYYLSQVFYDRPINCERLMDAIDNHFKLDCGGFYDQVKVSIDASDKSKRADIYIESTVKLTAGDMSRIQTFIFGWADACQISRKDND